MKRTFILALVFPLSFILLTSSLWDDSGQAGYTGSPLETTCNTTNCHNSFGLNSGTGSVSATSTFPNWAYYPGNTYTITVKVARTGSHLFGLGVELLDSTNQNGGTWTITNTAAMQIKTRIVGGISRSNVVHKLNGGSGQDSMLFSFNWTAPAVDKGDLKMYFCGNCTNANGQPTGDYIYSGSQVILSSISNGLKNPESTSAVSVYPNPATEFFTVSVQDNYSGKTVIKLFDSHGRIIISETDEQVNSIISKKINLPEYIKAGIYFISITGAVNYSGKLFVQ
jgi:hypothetical protein